MAVEYFAERLQRDYEAVKAWWYTAHKAAGGEPDTMQLVEAGRGDLGALALGGGENGDAKQAAEDVAPARGCSAGRHGHRDRVAILDEGLHGADSLGAELRWHDLSYFAVSHWIEQGFSIKVVTNFAGHASVQMTVERYGHLFPTPDRQKAMALVEQRVFG